MVLPTCSRAPRPVPRQQEGAAAVYAASAILGMVASTALAIDIGQLYYAQRDLQKLAASAAVDAARAFSGCYSAVGAPGSSSSVADALGSSLQSNLDRRLGIDALNPSEVQLPYGQNLATVEFGSFGRRVIDGVPTRVFIKRSFESPAVDAVQVNLARLAPTPLIPFLSGTAASMLHASAAAQQSPIASYTLSSNLATLSPPLLSALFGISIQAVGSSGLVNAGVTTTLANIGAALGIADPGQLLMTKLTLPGALQALADALSATANGTGNAAQGALAAELADLAALADPNSTSTLGSALGIEDEAAAAVATLPLNVVDLLTALAMDARSGLFPLKIPVSTKNLPGVTVNALLTLGEIGKSSTSDDPSRSKSQAAGRAGLDANGNFRTFAKTSQLGLAVRIGIDPGQLPILAPVLALLPGSGAQIKVGLDVTGSSVDSHLAGIHCPAPISAGTSKPVVDIVASSSAATVAVGTFSDPTVATPVTGGALISVLNNVLTINTNGAGPISTTLNTVPDTLLTFGPLDVLDPAGPNMTQSIGVGSADLASTITNLFNGLTNNLQAKTCLPIVGCSVLPTGMLASQLSPILSNVAKTVVDPLLTSLGLTVGGGTITLLSANYGTSAGDTAVATPTGVTAVSSTNSAPVLFSEAKPYYEVPVQSPTATR